MSAATESTAAALTDRRTSDRRQGVRRQADLTGWAHVLGSSIVEAWGADTIDRLAEMGVLAEADA